LYTWLAGSTLAACATSDGNLWTCNLTTIAGKQATIVWATRKPVTGYPTAGFGKLSRLDGASSTTRGSSITVTAEPVLLSS
jgi:hypothetical protein